jgi:hypothetical protein
MDSALYLFSYFPNLFSAYFLHFEAYRYIYTGKIFIVRWLGILWDTRDIHPPYQICSITVNLKYSTMPKICGNMKRINSIDETSMFEGTGLQNFFRKLSEKHITLYSEMILI